MHMKCHVCNKPFESVREILKGDGEVLYKISNLLFQTTTITAPIFFYQTGLQIIENTYQFSGYNQ